MKQRKNTLKGIPQNQGTGVYCELWYRVWHPEQNQLRAWGLCEMQTSKYSDS